MPFTEEVSHVLPWKIGDILQQPRYNEIVEPLQHLSQMLQIIIGVFIRFLIAHLYG